MSNAAPEGWKILSIGSVLKQEKRKFEMQDEESYPLLSVRRRNGGFFHRETRKGKQILTKTLTKAIPDSFVISKMQVVHGACGLIEKPFYNGYLSASYVSFMAKDGQADLRYFNYLCQTPFMYELFLLSSHGVHIEKMTFDVADWLRKKLVLPPLPEQQKIAAILSSVDDVIEKTRAQIDKLKDLKTGMMQALLTKGIGHTAFKDSPVGRIPEGWGVAPCGAVCTKITDGEHLSPKYVDKGFPILSAKDMRDYGIDFGGAKFVEEHAFMKMLRRCNPEYGDVLIVSRGATIGKTTLNNSKTPFALMGSVILLKPSRKCLGEFLSLFIASPFVQQSMLQLSGSSAQQAIYLKDIKEMPTPIPPISEQKKIADATNSVDSRILTLTHKLAASENLKKALMQDLLTGKLRVNVDNKENAVA